MKKFIFSWSLKRLKPRVDIKVDSTEQEKTLDRIMKFPYRLRQSKLNTRHYKLPVWYRSKMLRAHLESRLNSELDKLH